MFDDLPYLPCQQPLFASAPALVTGLWVHLPSQQRSGREYCAVGCLFMVKLPDCCIEQCDDMVHPPL
jgi:hypothetical protein